MTNDFKLKLYPAVIGVLGVCLVALLLSRIEVEVIQTEASTPPDVTSSPARSPSASPDLELPPSVASPTSTPDPSPSGVPAIPEPSSATGSEASLGSLRVSNQTNYPIRIALLHQSGTGSSTFAQPVHWDFAPEEGRTKGLILSLPNGDLRLRSGDVLVAFAQDGSRRYWGPYMVGETSLPVWNATATEWTLILED
ncbi:MAG: hypothetical protein HC769_08045 [Cyanobacteria bacterium CRU_2_1]|nr:hypothetical protein [Cyanobacteria bacterium RU_5_0]NJR58802.1 hypothetical protein [Cyanobacteria bacterium CRU_2_1]